MTARWYRISGTAPVCGWCLAEAVVIVAASLRCRPVCVNTSKKSVDFIGMLMKRILLLITCFSWPVSSLLASEIGDPDRGMRLYPVCTACHGAQGAGNAAMKAPKIAGQMSWYVCLLYTSDAADD